MWKQLFLQRRLQFPISDTLVSHLILELYAQSSLHSPMRSNEVLLTDKTLNTGSIWATGDVVIGPSTNYSKNIPTQYGGAFLYNAKFSF